MIRAIDLVSTEVLDHVNESIKTRAVYALLVELSHRESDVVFHVLIG